MGRGKKYAAISEKVDRETNYELHSAISFLKENATANFDETIEFAFRILLIPLRALLANTPALQALYAQR